MESRNSRSCSKAPLPRDLIPRAVGRAMDFPSFIHINNIPINYSLFLWLLGAAIPGKWGLEVFPPFWGAVKSPLNTSGDAQGSSSCSSAIPKNLTRVLLRPFPTKIPFPVPAQVSCSSCSPGLPANSWRAGSPPTWRPSCSS